MDENNKKSGFSLIEVIITISILSIIAAIGIPFVHSQREQAIVGQLRIIESIIHFLQQKALATHQEQALIIDASRQTLSYKGSFPEKEIVISLPFPLVFGFPQGAYGPPAKPEKPITECCTFEPNTSRPGCYHISIFSNGKISAGTVYIIDKNHFFAGALTCPVSQVSWIRIYVYENGRWMNK